MGRVCSGCKAYVEKALFSKNQWSKAATVSRCNVCVTDGIGGDNVGDGGTHMNNHGRRPSQSGDLESSSHLQMYRMDGMLKDGNNLEEIDISIAAAQHMDVDDGDDTLVVDIKTPAPPYLSRPRSNFHPPSKQQTLDGAGASGSIDGSTAPATEEPVGIPATEPAQVHFLAWRTYRHVANTPLPSAFKYSNLALGLAYICFGKFVRGDRGL